ncbi:MAG: pyridoxal phosphate-dependent aminotransferase [Bacteroidota bacterium]
MHPNPPDFSDAQVDLDLLRQRAYNLRWAEVPADTIALTAADPDFPVAPEIRAAIQEYTAGGYFSYGPAEGLPEFREVIAETMRSRKDIPCTAGTVLPTNSAAFAMFMVARYALQPGDEAIIFDPVDFLFQRSVEAAGGTVRRCPLDAEGRFDPAALEALVTPRTRMIGVCNPHNPTGHVLRKAELEAIAAVALRHELWIMDDCIWSDIIFAPQVHRCMASLGPEVAARTFSVFGFSKSFGLAGLRVGFVVAPDAKVFDELVELSLVRTTAFGVATLSQVAGIAAYRECWYWAEAFLAHLQGQRDYAVARLNAMEGVECHAPEGTYLLFPNVKAYGRSSMDIADHLRENAKVALVPGAARWFGPGAEGHLRICFSTSRGILEEGLNRMEAGLKSL